MTLTWAVGRYACRGLVLASMMQVCLLSGCMSRQLQFTARRTINALPELQYQQVVDNLAKIGSNPGFLPFLAVVGQGSVQVTDNGNSSMGLNLASKVFGAGTFSVGAARNVTGTWSLGTITSPEKIRAMQAAYLQALTGVGRGRSCVLLAEDRPAVRRAPTCELCRTL